MKPIFFNPAPPGFPRNPGRSLLHHARPVRRGADAHARADRRAVLPRQAAARHRQRPDHRQRRHHPGRGRDHPPDRADSRRQGQPDQQRHRRDLAVRRQGGLPPHRRQRRRRSATSNFQGFGRFLTGSTGEYYFRTIKPVAYPGRTPHIHFKIKKGGKELLSTQCYVKGEPQNERDGLHLSRHPRPQGPRLGDRSTSPRSRNRRSANWPPSSTSCWASRRRMKRRSK